MLVLGYFNFIKRDNVKILTNFLNRLNSNIGSFFKTMIIY